MSLLGIDVGTSSCKACLFDYSGRILASAHRDYRFESLASGFAEIDPEILWSSVKSVVRELAAAARGDLPKALSVSSFGEAVISVARDGRSLRSCILYFDRRGNDEAAMLESRIGRERLVAISGTRASGIYSLGKLMWLSRHEPALYEKTWKFLPISGYILFKLGGEARCDHSLAARTMAFDIARETWSSEILDYAGIDQSKLPEPIRSGEGLGSIDPGLADALGLPHGVLLVSGGHDQTCAALGAGVTESRVAVDGMGTVECITPAFDKPILNAAMSDSYFACVPHVVHGLYVTYAYNLTAGGLLRWYRDALAHEERELASRTGADVYDLILAGASKEPSGLLVLPYLAGAATPYMDPDARGAILGLSTSTTKADLVKGLLEGLCHEMALNLERLEQAGIPIDELRAVGGMARSRSYLALKADMLGKRIVTLDVEEAGTLGAAMLAGFAAGVFSSLGEAALACVRTRETFYPNLQSAALYKESHKAYAKVYPAIKTILDGTQRKES